MHIQELRDRWAEAWGRQTSNAGATSTTRPTHQTI